ncbi:6-phosphofructokinase [Alloiococcus sp. CFN-8]|uniref:6-phosphofructokinase n=1 Tax=Alloiococcus sp. CFN-8 TaxID=3416081 RepID=UPI003CF0770D
MANCIIAQSGGPTSVINASVVGLVKANKEHKLYDKVFGGINGIEGILSEHLIDLTNVSEEELETFKFTPSSGLGSCRYKLKSYETDEEEYKKLIAICNKNDIKSFFYIGGNDSMDTIAKLSEYGKSNNIDINFIGIPKTIDNDLPITDHTPGYGSAAKFIATSVLETYLDSCVYTNNGIFILETMGRDTGWLAAAATAARMNDKPVADFIYLPEHPFEVKSFLKDVSERFKENNQVYIVVSEGIKNKEGGFISELTPAQSHDNFGHSQLGGVAGVLKSFIIEAGITKRVKTLELGVLQRCAMHCSSKVDIQEAYEAGYFALLNSSPENNGNMVAIKREANAPYTSSSFLTEAKNIANHVKYMPESWINLEGNNVTEDAYNYVMPLISNSPELVLENNLPKFKVYNK